MYCSKNIRSNDDGVDQRLGTVLMSTNKHEICVG